MWLINTDTLELEYVMSHSPGSYAILSHSWEDGEVSFQDFKDQSSARKKKGFAKIERTVQIAQARGLRYAWVDTCCIDKSSSAELSEAINSMYQWYNDAAVCFAFLSDMPGEVTSHRPMREDFIQCKWFTRGWTLQELIAPRQLEFYDSTWQMFGTKQSLQTAISEVTNIDDGVLTGITPLGSIPIASRMSWASQRRTTRIEDMAYCLLGIFDVNMPLLYGEGIKAFLRLQEQLSTQTTDLSLLAWTAAPLDAETGKAAQEYRGIFANSPSEFRIAKFTHKAETTHYNEVAITNRGLRLEVYLHSLLHDNPVYALDLRCYSPQRKAVALARTAEGYVRCLPHLLFDISGNENLLPFDASTRNMVYISRFLSKDDSKTVAIQRQQSLFFRFGDDVKIHLAQPASLWDPVTNSFFCGPDLFKCAISFQRAGTLGFCTVIAYLHPPSNDSHSRMLEYTASTSMKGAFNSLGHIITNQTIKSSTSNVDMIKFLRGIACEVFAQEPNTIQINGIAQTQGAPYTASKVIWTVRSGNNTMMTPHICELFVTVEDGSEEIPKRGFFKLSPD